MSQQDPTLKKEFPVATNRAEMVKQVHENLGVFQAKSPFGVEELNKFKFELSMPGMEQRGMHSGMYTEIKLNELKESILPYISKAADEKNIPLEEAATIHALRRLAA